VVAEHDLSNFPTALFILSAFVQPDALFASPLLRPVVIRWIIEAWNFVRVLDDAAGRRQAAHDMRIVD
jgi:hypothetical protein